MPRKRFSARRDDPAHDPIVGVKTSAQPTITSLIALALLLIGAAAAIFLAGGASQGNLGVFLLCAGAALLLAPPRTRLSPALWLAAMVFLGCSASSLLPMRWFHQLLWREKLSVVPDLPLPTTVSAAPDQTLFWLGILTVTVLIGLFLLTQPVRSRALLALALAAVSVCGIYAALSIFAKLSGWVYPFSGGATFGFLPNRNHTATLLITGSILSVGILAVAFRASRWLTLDLAVATLVICVVGLFFFSESRAGVIFLLLGVVGWLIGLGGGHRDRRLLWVVALAGLCGGGLFLAIKSDARDRLLGSAPKVSVRQRMSTPSAPTDASTASERRGGEITADDRIKIYRDTLRVIRDAPLTGTGLGTFSLVFPMYRQDSANVSLVLHPESDWLMVAAETGLPALICLGGLIWLGWSNWRPAREHPYWPLRWAFLVAAGTAALHGLVDVPAHRAALGWWILALAGLALSPVPRQDPDAKPGQGGGFAARVIFVTGGIFAVVLGAWSVRAEWFGAPPLPPSVARRAEMELLRTFQGERSVQTVQLAREAVRVSPLYPPLYYQLGVRLLSLNDTEADAEAERAFRLQRLLSPFALDVPQNQGMAWLAIDPTRAASLLAEALRRKKHLVSGSVGAGGSIDYWQSLVGEAAPVAEAQRALWKISVENGPEFTLAWLNAATPELCKEQLARLANEPEALAKFTPEQRRRLLVLWESKGDRETLRIFVETHGNDWVDGK